MQWCLDINVLKSNIIHFRPKNVPISQFVFKCGTQDIKTTARTGILPLERETGRYVPIFYKTLKKYRKRTANERLCKLCRLNDIGNEYHFMCVCPVYNSRRTILFEEVELKHVHFHTLALSVKSIFVMKHCQIEVSKFIKRPGL